MTVWDAPTSAIVDTRSEDEYSGAWSAPGAAGRFPARCTSSGRENLDADGRFKRGGPRARCTSRIGVTPDGRSSPTARAAIGRRTPIWRCGSSASRDVRNYTGSWKEWGDREDLPIERAERPLATLPRLIDTVVDLPRLRIFPRQRLAHSMVGQHIGKYRVTDAIGRGGMGTVYRAVDETLHREVAIKVLNTELNDPAVARRFRAEAVTVARLNHPGIATIYELLQHDGQWLMVMEFVRGETLEALVARSGPLPRRASGRLCMQALSALAHAHSLGVVHRDLKPANLMLTESGIVKVMDFGIARVAGGEHLTSAGFMMGTPAYMAPEQVLGQEIDARTDLYATGRRASITSSTGKLPFKGTTPFEHGAGAAARASRRRSDRSAPDAAGVARAGHRDRARTRAGATISDRARSFVKRCGAGWRTCRIETPPPAVVPPELVATAAPGSMPVARHAADRRLPEVDASWSCRTRLRRRRRFGAANARRAASRRWRPRRPPRSPASAPSRSRSGPTIGAIAACWSLSIAALARHGGSSVAARRRLPAVPADASARAAGIAERRRRRTTVRRRSDAGAVAAGEFRRCRARCRRCLRHQPPPWPAPGVAAAAAAAPPVGSGAPAGRRSRDGLGPRAVGRSRRRAAIRSSSRTPVRFS